MFNVIYIAVIVSVCDVKYAVPNGTCGNLKCVATGMSPLAELYVFTIFRFSKVTSIILTNYLSVFIDHHLTCIVFYRKLRCFWFEIYFLRNEWKRNIVAPGKTI
jgi:hypothetical protein